MKSSKTPIILLLAIGLFISIGLQVGTFVAQWLDVGEEDATAAKTPISQRRSPTGGFDNIERIHSKTRIIEERLRQRVPRPIATPMPVAPHNLSTGPFDARVTLTIFNDPACPRCLAQAEDVLATIDTRKVRVVHKFFPADAQDFRGGNQHGGIFQQLALKYNVWPQLAQELQTRQNAPDLEEWVEMFGQLGVPLRQVRQDLRTDSPVIMRNLERDRELAQTALVDSIPTFYINDFLIDGKLLDLGMLQRSIARLEAGTPVLIADDLR